MSEKEIGNRIHQLLPPYGMWRYSLLRFSFRHQIDDEVQLWEKGYKDEVLHRHEQRLKTLRLKAPHIWRVLIDERNTLMAARLAWITTMRLKQTENAKVLALTGAAHVEGIKSLLGAPSQIRNELQELSLTFTVPELVRRISVN